MLGFGKTVIAAYSQAKTFLYHHVINDDGISVFHIQPDEIVSCLSIAYG